jgi:membrane protease YdiL (CAAX protease family)
MDTIGARVFARPNRPAAIGGTNSADTPYSLAVGLIFSLLVGIAIAWMQIAGADGGVATLLVLSLATAILFRVYPESPRDIGMGARLALVAVGVAAAVCWLSLTGWQLGPHSAQSWVDYPVYVLVQVVVAPLYEEKVVRHVLLSGLARRTGFAFAIIVVSAAFAAVHHGNFVAVMLFSLVAGTMAYFGFGSGQRALLHGANNAVMVAWQLTGTHWHLGA